MGRMGSTTSVRAGQMRRVLARWQRSGLTLREFGQQRGIPPRSRPLVHCVPSLGFAPPVRAAN
jgi:hypothetical protein